MSRINPIKPLDAPAEPQLKEPVADPTEPKQEPEKKVAATGKRKQSKHKKLVAAPPEKLEQLRATVPMPFRPSHLHAMIADYAKAERISLGDVRLKPWHFLDAFGLPNPKRLIAVQGITPDGEDMAIVEIEADDETDAKNQYSLNRIPAAESHRYRFRLVVREN